MWRVRCSPRESRELDRSGVVAITSGPPKLAHDPVERRRVAQCSPDGVTRGGRVPEHLERPTDRPRWKWCG